MKKINQKRYNLRSRSKMESKDTKVTKPTITLVSGNKSKLKEFKAIIGDIVNLDI